MTVKPKFNKKFKAKQRARRFAMQAIYQWQLTDAPYGDVAKQFLSLEEMVSVDTAYFKSILQNVIQQHDQLDEILKPVLDRPLQELDQVELAILRLAVCELCNQPELPYKVVLNEAIELAKNYGATDGFKYINGILHSLAKKCRPDEFKLL